VTGGGGWKDRERVGGERIDVDRGGRQRDAWSAVSEALGVRAIREVERNLAQGRVCSAASAVSAHSGTLAMVICRRHLPTWFTFREPAPTETFVSLKRPAVSVIADTSGSPDTSPQRSQEAPLFSAATGAFGT